MNARVLPAILAALSVPLGAQQPESLHYNLNWPSGLSLGEASLTAQKTAAGWDLRMAVDAAIPGFRISDRFHSVTNQQLCSLEFSREISQGSRKAGETTRFDDASGCARDALGYLLSLGRNLAQGTLPPPGQVFYGRSYSIDVAASGQKTINLDGKPQIADCLTVRLAGPASNSTFEIYFARDAARTPVLARIPTNLGPISVELSP
jgi:Protein of unknown function (DUF3108)